MDENNKINDEAKESLDSSLETTPDNQGELASSSEPPTVNNQSKQNKKEKLKQYLTKLSQKSSIYLPVFIILFIIVAVIAIVDYNHTNAPQANISQQQLTPQDLSHLANTNSVVGSSNQLLTVQSNAIFNSQVLMRNNLQVAGKLQVGGSLSLTGITVSNNSILNQTQINKNLSVNGNTSIQGTLTVQNNLSVNGSATFAGAVSAPQLTVNSLQLSGNLNLTHQIYAGGPIPTQTTSGNVGSGGTASVNGSDTAGTLTINTGNGPTAGCYLTVNFVNPFNSTPSVLLTPVGPNSANLFYYVNRSTSNFQVCSTNTPNASQTYTYDYFVIG